MTRAQIKNRYFEWLYELVPNDQGFRNCSYTRLLEHLHEVEFKYFMSKDGNRAKDGVNLRYRFTHEVHYNDSVISEHLKYPCSVLEMIVALAIRCEDVMCDPDVGDQTGYWFWIMIKNLGLGDMNDTRYDRIRVDEVIDILLNRKYGRDGAGGLFTIPNCKHDLRIMELWYQMCWYLDGISG